MSKIKVKNLKKMVSSLDINKLYKLQEYVDISQVFFKRLEFYVVEWEKLEYQYKSDYYFAKQVTDLYYEMKHKLDVK